MAYIYILRCENDELYVGYMAIARLNIFLSSLKYTNIL